MARSISQIYTSIITEKESFSELNGLTPVPETTQTLLNDLKSTSKVAIWRLWLWLVAVAIWIHENIFDQHIAEVEKLILNKTFGQLRWYEQTSKSFQLGYSLEWDDTDYRYKYSDTTSQAAINSKIITQAAATELTTGSGKQIVLKVEYRDWETN